MNVERAGRGHERELRGGREGGEWVRGWCQKEPEPLSVAHHWSQGSNESSFLVGRNDIISTPSLALIKLEQERGWRGSDRE